MVVLDAARKLSLTSEQQRVVACDAPAVLVKAAAGTGKTEILARKVERFINEPSNGYAHVMTITYTTRAAAELERRLQDRIGNLPSRITAQTIHGVANSMLLQHGTHVGLPLNFQLLTNNEDRAELFEQSYNTNLYIDDYRDLLGELDLARAKGEGHEKLEIWQQVLDNAGAVDYSDMLAKAYELLRKPAIASLYERVYGLIIVDEAQNLTNQQYQLLAALAGLPTDASRPSIPIMLLGDPKQSIIRFAGADNTLMDRFAKEFNAKKFVLRQNYRSAKVLATLARGVANILEKENTKDNFNLEYPAPGYIEVREFSNEESEGEHIAAWVEKYLREGLPREALLQDEPDDVKAEDIAILSRSSSTLRYANKALQQRGLESALVYSDKEFMSTDIGQIVILLMRKQSPSCKMAAELGLRRALRLESNTPDDGEIIQALKDHPNEHFDILIPLLDAASPDDMVSIVQDIHLPKHSKPDSLLAGWHDDQTFISETWQEFVTKTPAADRSWTRFTLHMDRSLRGRDLGPGVRLLTVHKAQGREFKAVAVIGMNDGQFPDFRASSPEESIAELNTFYVAVTRASRVLLFTRSLNRTTRFGLRRTEPSPYLEYVKAASET